MGWRLFPGCHQWCHSLHHKHLQNQSSPYLQVAAVNTDGAGRSNPSFKRNKQATKGGSNALNLFNQRKQGLVMQQGRRLQRTSNHSRKEFGTGESRKSSTSNPYAGPVSGLSRMSSVLSDPEYQALKGQIKRKNEVASAHRTDKLLTASNVDSEDKESTIDAA